MLFFGHAQHTRRARAQIACFDAERCAVVSEGGGLVRRRPRPHHAMALRSTMRTVTCACSAFGRSAKPFPKTPALGSVERSMDELKCTTRGCQGPCVVQFSLAMCRALCTQVSEIGKNELVGIPRPHSPSLAPVARRPRSC